MILFLRYFLLLSKGLSTWIDVLLPEEQKGELITSENPWLIKKLLIFSSFEVLGVVSSEGILIALGGMLSYPITRASSSAKSFWLLISLLYYGTLIDLPILKPRLLRDLI